MRCFNIRKTAVTNNMAALRFFFLVKNNPYRKLMKLRGVRGSIWNTVGHNGILELLPIKGEKGGGTDFGQQG